MHLFLPLVYLFFFNHTATTEIYTLSLHDALPIYVAGDDEGGVLRAVVAAEELDTVVVLVGHVLDVRQQSDGVVLVGRSEEHTSELQSHVNLVCRLLLEKKKQRYDINIMIIEESRL